jgi:hypothetical protein
MDGFVQLHIAEIWFLAFAGGGGRARDRAAQLVFYGIADAYCSANNLDLSAEPNAGRGPVDFRLARAIIRLRRSATTGFRALLFQFGGAIGLVMGSLGAWVFILLAKLPMDSVKPWVIGPLVGVLFGLLAAWMFNLRLGTNRRMDCTKLPGKKTVEVEPAIARDQ